MDAKPVDAKPWKAVTTLYAKVTDAEGNVLAELHSAAHCANGDNFSRQQGRAYAVRHLLLHDTLKAMKKYMADFSQPVESDDAGKAALRRALGSLMQMLPDDRQVRMPRNATAREAKECMEAYQNMADRSSHLRFFNRDDRTLIMRAICPEFFTDIVDRRKARRLAKRLHMELVESK